MALPAAPSAAVMASSVSALSEEKAQLLSRGGSAQGASPRSPSDRLGAVTGAVELQPLMLAGYQKARVTLCEEAGGPSSATRVLRVLPLTGEAHRAASEKAQAAGAAAAAARAAAAEAARGETQACFFFRLEA